MEGGGCWRWDVNTNLSQCRMHKNTTNNRWLYKYIALNKFFGKNTKMYNSKTFRGIDELLKTVLFQVIFLVSKFRGTNTTPAIWIRMNPDPGGSLKLHCLTVRGLGGGGGAS
jgi:hypothetical protein